MKDIVNLPINRYNIILDLDYEMYSSKFREKVIRALGNGRSIRRVASDFGISANTVIHWQKNIEPVLADKRRRAGKIDIQALLKDIKTYPDAYQ